VVARSTTEAEYSAMALGVAEMLWLRALLAELKVDQRAQMKLWCDNKSAISIANNPVQRDRTKHIEIDRFFIKEKLNSELLELGHVSTRDQAADCLTKGLNSLDLARGCDKMGFNGYLSPILRGSIEIYVLGFRLL
jgi:hypothetical protein